MTTVIQNYDVQFEVDYYLYGEDWENDPEQYVNDFRGYRHLFSEILDDVDYDAMVAEWEDDTLRDVVAYGSDLAFNKEQRGAINDAAKREWNRRNPGRVANGLTGEAYG
jgi:hypothetical protein